MANYRTSRILPIALVVIIIVIAVAALVSLARVVFFSGTSSAPAAVDTSRDALLNIASSHSVSMTIRGPIVADEVFHSIKITISASGRELKTYTGYLDTVVDKLKLGNNTAAYEQFVYALDKANFVKGTELTGDKDDVRGVCATGRVYEFTVLDNGSSVKHLWASTCNGSKGSLNASVAQLTELFVNQIPGAPQLIQKVEL